MILASKKKKKIKWAVERLSCGAGQAMLLVCISLDRIKEIHVLLKKQHQMLKVLSRREGFDEGNNEGGSRKGLMNWFFKKGNS